METALSCSVLFPVYSRIAVIRDRPPHHDHESNHRHDTREAIDPLNVVIKAPMLSGTVQQDSDEHHEQAVPWTWTRLNQDLWAVSSRFGSRKITK